MRRGWDLWGMGRGWDPWVLRGWDPLGDGVGEEELGP